MRAFEYVKHRVRRLPDTPERISRGIWAGVFVTFTPFFGLHFLLAMLLARVMRGNIFASIVGTFFGNPISFPFIIASALNSGHYMLGTRFERGGEETIVKKFSEAGADLWHNMKALFNTDTMDWHGLLVFFDEVFYPYLIGGIIPGIIAATVSYYVCLPLISSYQNRRRKKLRAKLRQLGKAVADEGGNQG